MPTDELFATFRALVNTREPTPASIDLLEAQDELLRGIIAEAGVTNVEDIDPCPPTRACVCGAATSRRSPSTPS